jgi:hypothetical protein
MSEFDKLKDDAEQYAQQHPQQVHEADQDAEHAVESRIGLGGEQDQANQGDDDQRGDDDQTTSQPQDAQPRQDQ